jgi:hypothetical protein
MRCPGGWALSRGGLPVPLPVSTGTERTIAIYNHFWDHLTAEEQNDPQWSLDNDDAWDVFFIRQHAERLAAYNGNGNPSSNYNISGQRRWWSATGRTLTWVLHYIADGNNPPLQMPP